MRKRHLPLRPAEAALSVKELGQHAEGWFADCELRQHSPNTIYTRRFVCNKLLWYLEGEGSEECGAAELRSFLAYVASGHKGKAGRWGNDDTRAHRGVRPSTIHTYYRVLRTFFAYLVDTGTLGTSPISAIKPPVSRPDQVQPFTAEQVQALFAAAKRSKNPTRDQALVAFLLDTGARAAEVCSLRREDVDLTSRQCAVLGKGNKRRTLAFSLVAKQALWAYIREQGHAPEDPLFMGDRGVCYGEALQRCGLLKAIHRLGEAAGITGVRCSPHTFRHTFAVSFLRNGGNTFTLQQFLGHTSLAMTNRYVALAQADLQAQHRAFSPADSILGRGRQGRGGRKGS